MKLSRKTFLKFSGASAIGVAMGKSGVDLFSAHAYAAKLRKNLRYARETTTICPNA